jgi:YaiO family outer membrane protein
MMSLVSASLLALVLLATPQAPDQRAEAERLARSGEHARALQQFQAIVAANPDDLAARLWIGRLHLWMGHPERAADVFRSIASADPRNTDALVGLGSALTSAGEFGEAADALNRAEAIAADSPAVLAAQGRLHGVMGHGRLAVAYYERALALDSTNHEMREEYDKLRAARAHRVEGTYYFEHFNGDVPDTHSGIVEVNGRVNDSVRLFVGGQHQRKFGRDEDRAGGGFEYATRGSVRVRGAGMFSGNANVLPDAAGSIETEFRARPLTWLAGARYLHFDGSSSVILSPGFAYAPNESVAFTVRYYWSDTDASDVDGSQHNDGFSAHVTARAARAVSVLGGYTRGFEGLSIITAERFTQFDADTVSGGVLFDVSPMTSFGATYEHQWRDAGIKVSTLYLSFVQRF